jgi:hypothetical protein
MSPWDDPRLLIKAGSFLPRALITQGMRLEETSWRRGAAKLAQDEEEDTSKLGKPRPNAILHGPFIPFIVSSVKNVKDPRTEGGQTELIAGHASAGGEKSLGLGWAIC